MKLTSKLLTIMIALSITSLAFADDHRDHRERHGNYVGAVSPRGNVYPHQEYRDYDRGCGSNCAIAIIGTAILGAVILNEAKQTPQPIIQQQPRQIVYIPSQVYCDSGIFINNIYHCPVYR